MAWISDLKHLLATNNSTTVMENITNELLSEKYSEPIIKELIKLLIEDKEVIRRLCWEMMNFIDTPYFGKWLQCLLLFSSDREFHRTDLLKVAIDAIVTTLHFSGIQRHEDLVLEVLKTLTQLIRSNHEQLPESISLVNVPDQMFSSLEFFSSYASSSQTSCPESERFLKLFVAELLAAVLKASPNIVQINYGQFFMLYKDALAAIVELLKLIPESYASDNRQREHCFCLLCELCALGTRFSKALDHAPEFSQDMFDTQALNSNQVVLEILSYVLRAIRSGLIPYIKTISFKSRTNLISSHLNLLNCLVDLYMKKDVDLDELSDLLVSNKYLVIALYLALEIPKLKSKGSTFLALILSRLTQKNRIYGFWDSSAEELVNTLQQGFLAITVKFCDILSSLVKSPLAINALIPLIYFHYRGNTGKDKMSINFSLEMIIKSASIVLEEKECRYLILKMLLDFLMVFSFNASNKIGNNESYQSIVHKILTKLLNKKQFVMFHESHEYLFELCQISNLLPNVLMDIIMSKVIDLDFKNSALELALKIVIFATEKYNDNKKALDSFLKNTNFLLALIDNIYQIVDWRTSSSATLLLATLSCSEVVRNIKAKKLIILDFVYADFIHLLMNVCFDNIGHVRNILKLVGILFCKHNSQKLFFIKIKYYDNECDIYYDIITLTNVLFFAFLVNPVLREEISFCLIAIFQYTYRKKSIWPNTIRELCASVQLHFVIEVVTATPIEVFRETNFITFLCDWLSIRYNLRMYAVEHDCFTSSLSRLAKFCNTYRQSLHGDATIKAKLLDLMKMIALFI